MTPDERNQCERMRRLLSDKDAQELFARLDAIYVDGWRRATTVEQREYYWCMAHALDDLKTVLVKFDQSITLEDHVLGLAEQRERALTKQLGGN